MATLALFKSSILRPSFCRFASSVNSAVIQQYGNPANVLKVQKTPLKEVTSKDVQVRMLASPITSFDIDAIAGKSPFGFSRLSVAGTQGVGIVQKIGEEVTSINEKDTVMIVKPFQGTWSEQIVLPESSIMRAPEGVATEISASLLHSAGIAYRLLTDFETLTPGDFIVQNDAASPVGMAVIQLAKARGLKTINIVKDCGEYSQLFRRLESMGADVIVRESLVHGVDFKKIMADLPAPKLAFNGRGGETMTNTCRLLKNATVVTYNDSTYEDFAMTSSYFTLNNLCLKGFNMNNWLKNAEMKDIQAMIDELAAMVRADTLRLYLKKDKFSQVGAAVKDAASPIADRTPVMLMDQ